MSQKPKLDRKGAKLPLLVDGKPNRDILDRLKNMGAKVDYEKGTAQFSMKQLGIDIKSKNQYSLITEATLKGKKADAKFANQISFSSSRINLNNKNGLYIMPQPKNVENFFRKELSSLLNEARK